MVARIARGVGPTHMDPLRRLSTTQEIGTLLDLIVALIAPGTGSGIADLRKHLDRGRLSGEYLSDLEKCSPGSGGVGVV